MTSPDLPAPVTPEHPPREPGHSARVLTHWSWAMIPATALGVLAAVLLGNALMAATGTAEGELLTSAGLAGWCASFAVTLTMLAAPLAGVLLGLLARRKGGTSATAPMLVNAAIAGAFALSAVGNLVGSLLG